MKTITEKFIDGKLVERITVEEYQPIPEPIPIRTDDPYPSPWWGIIPPPRNPCGWYTTTTTGDAHISGTSVANAKNTTYTAS